MSTARAVADEPGLGVGWIIEIDDTAGRVVGEQHAGLFEALADCGDPERQTAAIDAELGGCFGVAAATTHRVEVLVAVVIVDGAAGEHVGAADEVRVQVSAQHEDLDAVRAVAHQHHGRGIAKGNGRHEPSSPRGLSSRHSGGVTSPTFWTS